MFYSEFTFKSVIDMDAISQDLQVRIDWIFQKLLLFVQVMV